MSPTDLLSIMTQLTAVGEEKLKSSNDQLSRTSRATSKASAAKPNGDTADDTATKEIPPYIIAMFNTVITNHKERQDNATQEIKEYFEAELDKKHTYYEAELAKKDKTISELSKKSRANTFNLDALNQYTRSENIKLHGIEYTTGENTNQILKDVGKYCGVEIKDSDISITHRLMSKEEMEKQINPANRDTKVPVIIARLNRRDIKTKLMEGRKNITTNTQCPENLKKVIIYEDVTPLKSWIMYQLRQRNDKQAFRYVWSKGGRIFAHTPENAAKPRDQQDKPYVINTPDDLSKIGFSEEEIENIINNVRP